MWGKRWKIPDKVHFSITRKLGGYYAQVPIIAFTASLFSHELKTIIECGMDGFVIKPFFPNDLYKKIKPYLSVKPSH